MQTQIAIKKVAGPGASKTWLGLGASIVVAADPHRERQNVGQHAVDNVRPHALKRMRVMSGAQGPVSTEEMTAMVTFASDFVAACDRRNPEMLTPPTGVECPDLAAVLEGHFGTADDAKVVMDMLSAKAICSTEDLYRFVQACEMNAVRDLQVFGLNARQAAIVVRAVRPA